MLTTHPGVDIRVSVPKLANHIVDGVQLLHRDEQLRPLQLETEHVLPLRKDLALYDKVSQIEVNLHWQIKHRLEEELGSSEDQWWAKGVPEGVRKDCATRREEDATRQALYNYTNPLDLQRILDKNWKLFETHFRGISSECRSKKEFLDRFVEFNEIRKLAMHPIRLLGDLTNQLESITAFADLIQRFFTPAEAITGPSEGLR